MKTRTTIPLTIDEAIRIARAPLPTFHVVRGRTWGGASSDLSIRAILNSGRHRPSVWNDDGGTLNPDWVEAQYSR